MKKTLILSLVAIASVALAQIEVKPEIKTVSTAKVPPLRLNKEQTQAALASMSGSISNIVTFSPEVVSGIRSIQILVLPDGSSVTTITLSRTNAP